MQEEDGEGYSEHFMMQMAIIIQLFVLFRLTLLIQIGQIVFEYFNQVITMHVVQRKHVFKVYADILKQML